MKKYITMSVAVLFIGSLTGCQTIPYHRGYSRGGGDCDDNVDQVAAVGEIVSVLAGTAIPLIQGLGGYGYDQRYYGGYRGSPHMYRGGYQRGGSYYNYNRYPSQQHYYRPPYRHYRKPCPRPPYPYYRGY